MSDNKTPIQLAIERLDAKIEMHRAIRIGAAKARDSKTHHRQHGAVVELIQFRQTLTELLALEEEAIKKNNSKRIALEFNDWLIQNCSLGEDIWNYNGEDYSLEELFEIFTNRFKPE